MTMTMKKKTKGEKGIDRRGGGGGGGEAIVASMRGGDLESVAITMRNAATSDAWKAVGDHIVCGSHLPLRFFFKLKKSNFINDYLHTVEGHWPHIRLYPI